MRAHFAVENSFEKDPLDKRIQEFKDNPDDMQIVVDFINNILVTAQKEVENKLQSQQDDGKSSKESERQTSVLSHIKNGKIINRARGVVTRFFDVLCNRANLSSGSTQRTSGKKASKD